MEVNRKEVERMLPLAYRAIRDASADETMLDPDGALNKTFRGYIAAYGAAILQSGLLPATAFFMHDDKAKCPRSRLLQAILRTIDPEAEASATLAQWLLSQSAQPTVITRQRVLDAACAVKLAMALFPWIEKKEEKEEASS